MAAFEVSSLGLSFPNPIIAGSSALTGTIGGIKKLSEAGVGGIVLKSLFEEQILMASRAEANKGGVIYGLDEIDDYIGFYERKHSLAEYVALIKAAKQETDIPVIASINCATEGEWTAFASDIEAAGADALQLNIFALRAQDLSAIVRAVKARIHIPLIAKIGYYNSDIAAAVHELEAAGANAAVLFNRPYSIDFDIEKMTLMQGAFYSGHEEMVHPLRWISLIYGRTGLPLFASTGVQDGDDVVKMLLAGAAGIEVVSAFRRHPESVISAMKDRLGEWMQAHQFERVEAFRGLMSQATSRIPEQYERVQYMKYYGDLE